MSNTLRTIVHRLHLLIDQRRADNPVRRTIRGIPMHLPRHHGLHYFVRSNPRYADNLIELAKSVARHGDGTISLLDVGANVGDSTMFVLDQVPGTAVCLEANPRWQPYLERNLGHRSDVIVVPAVLVASDADTSVLSMRSADIGTSIVVREDDPSEPALPAMTTDELLSLVPHLDRVRLIKSDTDGYDIMLMHAYLKSFQTSKPVLFFEYDPRPTRLTTPEYEPRELWPELHDNGYERAVVWDNMGRILHRASTRELAELSAVLDETTLKERGYGFWDVAVVHCDDAAGLAVLDEVAGDRPRQTG